MLEKALTNPNCTHEEINSTMNSRNAWYHSVHNILSSSLIPKNIKIKLPRTIIVPVIFLGCGICPLTLRDEHKLKVM
jgi:hypothetical protein